MVDKRRHSALSLYLSISHAPFHPFPFFSQSPSALTVKIQQRFGVFITNVGGGGLGMAEGDREEIDCENPKAPHLPSVPTRAS